VTIESSKEQYKMSEVEYFHDIHNAIKEKDIICTDSISIVYLTDFKGYKITLVIMKLIDNNENYRRYYGRKKSGNNGLYCEI
jgi:ornithine carbamoyltransferase